MSHSKLEVVVTEGLASPRETGSTSTVASSPTVAADSMRMSASMPEAGLNLQTVTRRVFVTICAVTCFLTGLGGFINGSAAAGVFKATVTHLTGTTTRWAILTETPNPNSLYGADFYGIQVLAYLLGSTLGGTVLGKERSKVGRLQAVVLGLESALLWLAVILYGFDNTIPSAHCLAAACGVQNSMTSNMSFVTLRTTSVTGSITDIGSAIGLVLRAGWKEHGWRLMFWVPAYVSFWIGCFLGALSFQRLGSDVLYVAPSVLSAVTIGVAIYTTVWGPCRPKAQAAESPRAARVELMRSRRGMADAEL